MCNLWTWYRIHLDSPLRLDIFVWKHSIRVLMQVITRITLVISVRWFFIPSLGKLLGSAYSIGCLITSMDYLFCTCYDILPPSKRKPAYMSYLLQHLTNSLGTDNYSFLPPSRALMKDMMNFNEFQCHNCIGHHGLYPQIRQLYGI